MVTKDIYLENFERIADDVKPDAKKRIVLRRVQIQKGVRYHIYTNNIGQIVLDPQVTIPASELWLFNNPKALEMVKQGISEAKQGKISKVELDDL
jgi:hypothetical protein